MQDDPSVAGDDSVSAADARSTVTFLGLQEQPTRVPIRVIYRQPSTQGTAFWESSIEFSASVGKASVYISVPFNASEATPAEWTVGATDTLRDVAVGGRTKEGVAFFAESGSVSFQRQGDEATLTLANIILKSETGASMPGDGLVRGQLAMDCEAFDGLKDMGGESQGDAQVGVGTYQWKADPDWTSEFCRSLQASP